MLTELLKKFDDDDYPADFVEDPQFGRVVLLTTVHKNSYTLKFAFEIIQGQLAFRCQVRLPQFYNYEIANGAVVPVSLLQNNDDAIIGYCLKCVKMTNNELVRSLQATLNGVRGLSKLCTR